MGNCKIGGVSGGSLSLAVDGVSVSEAWSALGGASCSVTLSAQALTGMDASIGVVSLFMLKLIGLSSRGVDIVAVDIIGLLLLQVRQRIEGDKLIYRV